MRVHFIGIGGIGVSALAQYYLAKGHKVSGSDLVRSEITDSFERKGVKIHIGKTVDSRLQRADLVIYSPAVGPGSPELKAAKKKKIKCLSYPQALGELTKKYFTIAVSGTHGKSTTTSMIGLLLVKAGLDPSVIVGTKIKEFGNSNFRAGKSKTELRNNGAKVKKRAKPSLPYLVIEADEHFASFLNYWPKIIVLTSIEADHLDFYKNLRNVLRTFKKYIGHLGKGGVLVANKDDGNIKQVINNKKQKTFFYSLNQPEAERLRKILKVPGEHNVSNALAALTLARILKIPDKVSLKALSEYKGSWRRFEERKAGGLTVISDYGHHPTEIRVTLKAAREKYPKKKIWCVYQPHQYQRTYYLFKDFVKVFRQAPTDKIIITDIYDVAGREEKEIKKKINSEKLARAVRKESVTYLGKNKLPDFLKKGFPREGVLIIMGAGDIYKLVDSLGR